MGDANPDVVLRGDVVPRFGQAEQLLDAADVVMGGSATIMACGAARAGVPTSVIAHVGDDSFGRFIVDTLVERGVDVRTIRRHVDRSTGVSVILSAPADRSILTHLGAMVEVRADDLDPGTVPAGTHVHAASLFLLPGLADGLAELFAALRERGCSTSLDTNWDPAQRWDGVLDVLRHTDLFFPNEAELTALTGHADADRAAATLTAHGVTVAAKRGADGATLWTVDGHREHAGVLPVEVADTTGAGDSFDAGYLAAWLRGLPHSTCLAAAARAGSLSCRAAGGIAAQGTWAEIDPR